MTPEDTTRLREHAEAVRNAGARIVQTRDPGGPAYWAAHHDLREAKARLYLGAPPDSIILALLDEVERLRAIFDDAGQGEHNVLALVEHYQQQAMDADERAALAYPRALQAAASVAVDMCETRRKHGLSGSSFERVAEDILALTPEDIERITKEHEHG